MMQVPALIQFEGHPEVSETGDLVYVFPTLQRTARQQVGTLLRLHASLLAAQVAQSATRIALGIKCVSYHPCMTSGPSSQSYKAVS